MTHNPQENANGHGTVLIVGAGPVGLTLAAFLHLNKIRFKLIDSKSGIVGDSRALGVHARTLELLQPLGLANTFVRHGRPTRYMTFHMGDRPLFSFDFNFLKRETSFPFYLILPQNQTEAILQDWLARHGEHIAWNTSLVDFQESDTGIKACFNDGKEEHFTYIAGCDGASSTVRNKLGIGFTGKTYDARFVLAEVRIAEDRLRTDSTHVLMTRDATVAAIPLPNGAYRLVGPDSRSMNQNGPASMLSFENFVSFLDRNRLLRHVSLHDPQRVVSYRMQKRVADQFQKNRVFLAGDAAHIHSPAGGQGMNSGIQDAANLAWKLGMVIRGEAPVTLLNSYETERRKIALRTAEATDRAMQITNMNSPLRRMLLRLFSPVVFALYQPKGLIRAMAQLAIQYGETMTGLTPGKRMPWLELTNGGDLFDHIAVQGLTLIETDAANRLADTPIAVKRILLADNRYFRPQAASDNALALPIRLADLNRMDKAAKLLVRPDGYILAIDKKATGTNCMTALKRLSLTGMIS